MITTIIFDLGDVFLHGAKGSWKHIKQFHNISDSKILIDELDQLFLGEITEQQYWEMVIKKNCWDIGVNELKIAVRKNFGEVKGVRKVIEQLRNKGFKLGLLSNHAKEWVEYCETTYKYTHLFHTTLYSYEVKLSKPDLHIFLLVLKKLQVKPEECLFIDDYIKNIAAAQELGFNTIHFTSAQKLKKELAALKIKL